MRRTCWKLSINHLLQTHTHVTAIGSPDQRETLLPERECVRFKVKEAGWPSDTPDDGSVCLSHQAAVELMLMERRSVPAAKAVLAAARELGATWEVRARRSAQLSCHPVCLDAGVQYACSQGGG